METFKLKLYDAFGHILIENYRINALNTGFSHHVIESHNSIKDSHI